MKKLLTGPLSKIMGLYLLILGLLVLMGSCNPVKRVLKDPVKFNRVAEEVARRGYCVNDTVTRTITRDTIIHQDTVIRDTVVANCPDFTRKLPSGIVVKSTGGVLDVTVPWKREIHQKDIQTTNSIRDKKLEEILKKDIASRDSIIANREGQIAAGNKTIKSLNATIKEKNKQLGVFKMKIWMLGSLLLIAVGSILVSGIKKILP